MSTQAPWLALAVDWQDSEMFEDATPEERLAWICLLCHAKTNGRAGVVKANPEVLVKRWQISKTAVTSMMDRATRAGAIENGTDNVVSVVNWKTYQDPRHRSARTQPVTRQRVTGKQGRFTKTPVKDATPYPLPLEDHKTTKTPPTPPGERDQNRTSSENLFPPESPPPKNPVKRQRKNNKQAGADALVLYEAYPIHKGKLAALKAIRKALKTVPVAQLMPKVVEFAASEYVQTRLGTPEEQFIKRAATWFNAGSWMDESTKSIGSTWLEE